MKNYHAQMNLALFGALLLASGVTASAQSAPTQVQAQIKDITVMMQKTPQFNASTSDNKKDGKRREWLEIEVEFETRSDSDIGIVPEVLVQFYAAVKDSSGQALVLSDSYTYLNVVDKEESFAIVYSSPAALTSISGEIDKFREGDVLAAGVEILYQGRVIAEEGVRQPAGWWTKTQASRVTGKLAAKEDTPFGLLWIDRHLQRKSN